VPEISVVIPTRARTTRLRLTLHALANQTLAPQRYDVVIVNDGPNSTPLQSAIAGVAPSYRLTVLETGGAGVGTARNTGARAARAPIVLFLDDDTVPAVDCLESHLVAHSGSPRAVVHGRVWDLTAFRFTPDPAAAASHLEGPRSRTLGVEDLPLDAASVRRYGPRRSFIERLAEEVMRRDDCRALGWLSCIGTNTSVGAGRFWGCGGFDERFGDLWGGEDLELGLRLAADGCDFLVIDAVAYHLPQARVDAHGSLIAFWRRAAETHNTPSLRRVAALLQGNVALDDFAHTFVAPARSGGSHDRSLW